MPPQKITYQLATKYALETLQLTDLCQFSKNLMHISIKIHPGNNVGKGKDDTLFATETGNVVYHERKGRKLASIQPVEG